MNFVIHGNPGATASRISEGNGARMIKGRNQHVSQFVFILWCHDYHIREVAKIGKVKQTVMRGSIFTNNSPTVHGKDHGMLFKAYIVKDLVIGSLQKGGIDRNHRTKSLNSHAGRKGHGMLLGDTNIKKAFGKGLGKGLESGSLGHGCRDRHNTLIFSRKLNHGISKDFRIGRRFFLMGNIIARCDFKRPNAMKIRRVALCRRITFAFFRRDVKQDRLGHLLYVPECVDQVVQPMTLDGTKIFKLERFKEHPRRNKGLERVFGSLGKLVYVIPELGKGL